LENNTVEVTRERATTLGFALVYVPNGIVMSTNAYDDILSRAQQELSPEEQLKLVNALCQYAGAKGRRHRILELRGLGKEIWAGIDPDEYVRKERDSWNG
jgi:hypothetical protein